MWSGEFLWFRADYFLLHELFVVLNYGCVSPKVVHFFLEQSRSSNLTGEPVRKDYSIQYQSQRASRDKGRGVKGRVQADIKLNGKVYISWH